MSFIHLFSWLAHTHIALAMRDSTWAFAIVEIVHLIGLTVFGGAVLFVDLRLMGFSFGEQPVSQVARELLPVTLVGVIVMFVTGVLLLASGPMRYFYNTPFRIKMWLFFIALIFHFVLQIRVSRKKPEWNRYASALRVAGATSLLLWLSIGMAGRAIGYF
jgi:hypothetical protein